MRSIGSLSVGSRNFLSIHDRDSEVRAPELNPLFETAQSAWDKSCYRNIDWKIHGGQDVANAVTRMATYSIGALAVVDVAENVIGILSERDILTKVTLQGLATGSVKVEAIATLAPNLITVSNEDAIDSCMTKLLDANIRHLLVQNSKDDENIVGLMSMKDILKCYRAKNLAVKSRLEGIIQYQNLGV